MSGTSELVAAIKRELKQAGLTYADLARALGMAESSIKRMLSRGDMPLSRIDEILRVLKLDFADVARAVADARPPLRELTLEQERAVVADPGLLLVALSVLSQWTFEQILQTYRFTEAGLTGAFARLDRLGIIELRPFNRYRLKLSKTFRWHPHGPVMAYFRAQVLDDYFGGTFDAAGETLLLVHGSVSDGQAALFTERIQRVAQEFAQQHLADQRLPEAQRDGYTLVLAMRRWEFSKFTEMRRAPAGGAAAAPASRRRRAGG